MHRILCFVCVEHCLRLLLKERWAFAVIVGLAVTPLRVYLIIVCRYRLRRHLQEEHRANLLRVHQDKKRLSEAARRQWEQQMQEVRADPMSSLFAWLCSRRDYLCSRRIHLYSERFCRVCRFWCRASACRPLSSSRIDVCMYWR